jgi:hypothetical protein
LVSGDRRHERQGRQAPPRDLQLGLEDAGYEPAARCLSDELGAWVVQLRNPLRHRERSRSTNFLERSLGEVRERRPPLAGGERVNGENDRAAGATDALGERSVARAPSSERGGTGRRARRRRSREDWTSSTCRDLWCRLHRLYICVRDPAGRLATTTKGKS